MFLSSSRIPSKNAYVLKIKAEPAKVDGSCYESLVEQLVDYPTLVENLKSYEQFRDGGERYCHFYVNYTDRCYSMVNLGVIKDLSKPYLVEISFQDLLPLVLHRITGCDLHSLDRLDNIKEYSRILLNLEFDKMDIPLSVFLHKDDKLDEYFRSITATKAYDLVDKIICDIQKELVNLKEGFCTNIALYNSQVSEREKLIPLSYGFSSIIFKTGTPINEEIILDGVAKLNPRCVLSGEIPNPEFEYGGVM